MTKTITRTLGPSILNASESFKVVLLTGPRQVGKTTLLQALQKKTRAYVTLDDLDMRLAAWPFYSSRVFLKPRNRGAAAMTRFYLSWKI